VDNKVSFLVSYDVVRDDDKYGPALPEDLGLTHRHVVAGISSQATLQGRRRVTIESLYLSPALVSRLGGEPEIAGRLDQAHPTSPTPPASPHQNASCSRAASVSG
jgi:DNA adenine methylase